MSFTLGKLRSIHQPVVLTLPKRSHCSPYCRSVLIHSALCHALKTCLIPQALLSRSFTNPHPKILLERSLMLQIVSLLPFRRENVSSILPEFLFSLLHKPRCPKKQAIPFSLSACPSFPTCLDRVFPRNLRTDRPPLFLEGEDPSSVYLLPERLLALTERRVATCKFLTTTVTPILALALLLSVITLGIRDGLRASSFQGYYISTQFCKEKPEKK